MANTMHVQLLRQGAEVWNRWREANPDAQPDLREADLTDLDLAGANLVRARLAKAYLTRVQLSGADLRGADLTETELQEANLSKSNLTEANLTEASLNSTDLTAANLIRAELIGANLSGANLQGADLTGANLTEADLWRTNLDGAILCEATLYKADLRGASLARADLTKASLGAASLLSTQLPGATLVQANLRSADLRYTNLAGSDLRAADLVDARLILADLQNANLTDCRVYGISAWDLKLDGAIQSNLIITLPHEPTITVDDLEVAQFIYLLLNNRKIRKVIDTIASKAVLILGRFTPERKAILDRLRDELRQRDYVPIVFDFDKPTNEDFTGTIKTLAGMCHFVIADITNPKSSPLELQATVPDYMIPFVPIIQENEEPFAMFVDLWIRHRDWVLEPLKYVAAEDLIAVLEEAIIQPAEQRYAELTLRKAQALMTRHTSQYRSNA